MSFCSSSQEKKKWSESILKNLILTLSLGFFIGESLKAKPWFFSWGNQEKPPLHHHSRESSFEILGHPQEEENSLLNASQTSKKNAFFHRKNSHGSLSSISSLGLEEEKKSIFQPKKFLFHKESVEDIRKNADAFHPRYTQKGPFQTLNIDELSVHESINLSSYSDDFVMSKDEKKSSLGRKLSKDSLMDMEKDPHEILRDILLDPPSHHEVEEKEESIFDNPLLSSGILQFHDVEKNSNFSFQLRDTYGILQNNPLFQKYDGQKNKQEDHFSLFHRLGALSQKISALENNRKILGPLMGASFLNPRGYRYPKPFGSYNWGAFFSMTSTIREPFKANHIQGKILTKKEHLEKKKEEISKKKSELSQKKKVIINNLKKLLK